jgi:hypothetical protein
VTWQSETLMVHSDISNSKTMGTGWNNWQWPIFDGKFCVKKTTGRQANLE